jgi:hypothetical protein
MPNDAAVHKGQWMPIEDRQNDDVGVHRWMLLLLFNDCSSESTFGEIGT